MATKKKPKLESVNDAPVEETVQQLIDDNGNTPAVSQAAKVMGDPQPNTHIIIDVATANSMVAFFMGHGSDFAKNLAGHIVQARGVRVQQSSD